MEEVQNEGLNREIGVMDVAINAVNNIIGGGIFILPAIIAINLGNASILAYLICAIMLLLVMLCFAEISSRINSSGGAYIYVEKSFGPFAGFLTSGFSWFGAGVLADAAVANGMFDMIAKFFPIFLDKIYRGIFFFFLFSGYALINIRGVKGAMLFVKLNTLIKLIPLLLIVGFGIFQINPSNLTWNEFPPFENLGAACLILFFAFQGGESALNLGGEMKDPKRTAPYGILLGVGAVVVFYILIQTVAQGILGTDLQNHKDAPLAAVGEFLFGPIGKTILSLGAIISIFSNLASSPLLFPRITFAASKNKLLPKFLSNIHPRFATPYWSIIIYAIFSFIMAISGGFRQLAVISSASILIIYFAVVLSTIKWRLSKFDFPIDAFKMPGGLLIPISALIIIILFLLNLKLYELTDIGIFILCLSAMFFMNKWRK